MALLKMVLRKMVKNKWLTLSLLFGLIISVALISSIPMYTKAVLQNLLIKDLENYQKANDFYPGSYLVTSSLDIDSLNKIISEIPDKNTSILKNEKVIKFYDDRFNNFNKLEKYVKEKAGANIGLPVLASMNNYSIEVRNMVSDIYKEGDTQKGEYAKLQSLSNIGDHIILTDGHMPEKKLVDGVFESLVPESALKNFYITLGQIFVLNDPRNKEFAPIKVKPVGSFKIKDERDLYWSYFPPDNFSDSFLIDEELMRNEIINKKPTLIQYARWYFAFDYHAITTDNLESIIAGNEKNISELKNIDEDLDISALQMNTISSYLKKEDQLKIMIWTLYTPVIIMLFIYIIMTAWLVMEREKNEIAMLVSRGAKRNQIIIEYLIEGVILSIVALLIGPWIGLLLCKVLGSSSGFMQFVNRKSLNVTISTAAYLYAILAVCAAMLAMLVPAITASKINIVSYKKEIARKNKVTIWEKSFLDIVLICIAAYGYYAFVSRQRIMQVTGASANSVQIDPLLFLIPALFILGISLLFLRIYPWIMRAIFLAGKRFWPPEVYEPLIQVSRSSRNYHFLMVFLTLTLSVGIFSATSARTLNLNAEEKIYYRNGSDIVLNEAWETSESSDVNVEGKKVETGESKNDNKENLGSMSIQYTEPSFLPFTQLPGISHAAKVFIKEGISGDANGKSISNTKMMAIDPYDFGQVAWFRKDLLPHHINEYLNLLSGEPSSCLVSKSFSETCKVKPGDYISVGWDTLNKAVLNVYGVIDYWPSWNPEKDPDSLQKGSPNLIVANLPYIQDHLSMEPYSIWLKMKPDATSQQVYEAIKKENIPVLSLRDSRQEILKLRSSDPFQLTINGLMTMGFLISGVICLIGFLIYWVITLGSRTLQFGIFRAMGISVKQLIRMMACEQFFTSGVSMAAGILIGGLTSRIFAQLFQISYNAELQVPPFKVVSYISDRLKVYLLIAIIMILGLLILIYLLSRIKIHQAIKLGED